MERVLVSMNTRHGAWEAFSRAISLARRMDAKIYALLVLPSHAAAGGVMDKNASAVKERLELLIEAAKSENIPIDYFISEGKYEEEVIRFINQNKITLLVVESPESDSRELHLIESFRHRTTCRMEVISLRKDQQFNAKEGKKNEYSDPSVSADRRK
jgi:nucleotide-binding universal stress UspA family protein